jgi:hypothetical protein
LIFLSIPAFPHIDTKKAHTTTKSIVIKGAPLSGKKAHIKQDVVCNILKEALSDAVIKVNTQKS